MGKEKINHKVGDIIEIGENPAIIVGDSGGNFLGFLFTNPPELFELPHDSYIIGLDINIYEDAILHVNDFELLEELSIYMLDMCPCVGIKEEHAMVLRDLRKLWESLAFGDFRNYSKVIARAEDEKIKNIIWNGSSIENEMVIVNSYNFD